jgi:hypothetical protein
MLHAERVSCPARGFPLDRSAVRLQGEQLSPARPNALGLGSARTPARGLASSRAHPYTPGGIYQRDPPPTTPALDGASGGLHQPSFAADNLSHAFPRVLRPPICFSVPCSLILRRAPAPRAPPTGPPVAQSAQPHRSVRSSVADAQPAPLAGSLGFIQTLWLARDSFALVDSLLHRSISLRFAPARIHCPGLQSV